MLVIKRYPNRKLYDTDAKRYVSLDKIADLIRGGAEVQVLDNASGDDVTSLVLMQVIVDQEKRQAGFLPQPVLASLVQAGGDTLTALRRALVSPLELLRQVDEEIEHRVDVLVRAGELGAEDGKNLRTKLLDLGQRAYATWPDELKLTQMLTRYGLPTRNDVKTLADQVDLLEAEVMRLSVPSQPAGAALEPIIEAPKRRRAPKRKETPLSRRDRAAGLE